MKNRKMRSRIKRGKKNNLKQNKINVQCKQKREKIDTN